jgi:hypothetical protein
MIAGPSSDRWAFAVVGDSSHPTARPIASVLE